MPYKVLPLFKSHYSLGKSILTLEKPTGKPDSYPTSIFDLLLLNKLDTLVLVEDNISGLLQASQVAEANKIKLIFGIRFDIVDDIIKKDETTLTKRAKYIIFAKNTEGYSSLLKLWTIASTDGFYYSPSLDWNTLKKHWNKNLSLVVPFYDSFLELNALNSHIHVPELNGLGNIVFLSEDNNLPFDYLIQDQIKKYCQDKYPILPAQSIYYASEDDFEAYLAFRCIHHRGGSQKSTLERPELDHMGSNQFNFNKWFKNNQ